MKRGLRLTGKTVKDLGCSGPETHPDEEGIKTPRRDVNHQPLLRPETHPDEEGIKTSRTHNGNCATGVRRPTPMKRGLRPLACSCCRLGQQSPETHPDEEGIKTALLGIIELFLNLSGDPPR